MNRNPASNPIPGRPADPSQVLALEDLSGADKIALLKDMQLDLTDRMTATNENMSETADEGQLAELHRHVSRTLNILELKEPGH